MKLLVIGTQLSGKSTIVRYLRKHTDQHASEIDEEILSANDGVWPEDNKYKDEVLVPAIYKRIAGQEDIVFFANYFTPLSQVDIFKNAGFTVVQLELPYDEMLRRNKQRMESEGYEDATQWLKGQIDNHREIREAGLVERTVDATLSTSEIVQQLITQNPTETKPS